MGQRNFLLGLAIGLLVPIAPLATLSAYASCNGQQEWDGTCVSNDGDSVGIGISIGGGESGGGGGGGGADSSGSGEASNDTAAGDGGSNSTPDSTPAPSLPQLPSFCTSDPRVPARVPCAPPPTHTPDTPQAPAPPPLPTTLSARKLTNITPQPGTLHAEPISADGILFGITGQPVNTWITTTTHTLAATILGHPVQVTFTPVAATINFGDGTTVTVDPATTGSWATLGLTDLTDTPASHRYHQRGNATITATIAYSATVHTQDRNIPVTGTITRTTPPTTLRILEYHRYLIPNTP